jgi:hypothetical protein
LAEEGFGAGGRGGEGELAAEEEEGSDAVHASDGVDDCMISRGA